MSAESELLVTVVVLSYNGRRCLDACLKSVLDQDFPRDRYEVVLVDNGSSDGSPDYVAQRLPEVRVVRLDRNYGCAEGANQAVPHCRARYMGFLNQDCVVLRRWLAELLAAFQGEPLARLAHSNTIFPWWPEAATRERKELVRQAYSGWRPDSTVWLPAREMGVGSSPTRWPEAMTQALDNRPEEAL